MEPQAHRSLYTAKSEWMAVYVYIWIAASHVLMTASKLEGPQEYCQWETFNATCGPNQVILMTAANYGRMSFGRCVKEDHGNVGCSSDVLRKFDAKCSGRQSCNVTIPDPSLHNNHPCPRELVLYLEAEYGCLPVQTGTRSQCLTYNGVTVSRGNGYLASSTPIEKGFGTTQCPWIIEAGKGQRINLTLIDFGNDRQSSTNSATSEKTDCSSDIQVIENGRRSTISACGQISRKRIFYISSTNQIRVYIENRHSKFRTNFIIGYGTVGCADIPEMRYAWSTRTGDTAVVKCNHTGETFFLSCDGTEWKGESGNCTAHGSSKKTEERDYNFPYGLLFVIGIGVALGVAFGILMLFGILFCLRRRRQKQTRGHTMDPLLSEHPQDPEDSLSNIYDKTRIIRCPHGLAAINLNPESPYYPEGLEHHPAVSLTTVSGPSPYSLDNEIVHTADRGDAIVEGIYSRDEHNTLSKAYSKRKNEMQTSFMTFRPSVIQEEVRENVGDTAYRSLRRNTDNSLDLLRDSRPYRELNPESLDCACSLRHGPSHMCVNQSETDGGSNNTAL